VTDPQHDKTTAITNLKGSGSDSIAATQGGLLRSGTIVSAMTLISRILGFVRDQVLAIFFGAGALTDVFLVAWKIPNFLRKLFAEGAFAQGFIPVFAEYKETRSGDDLKALAAHVSGALVIVLLLVTTIGVMLAPFLVMIFAPGFSSSGEQFELATRMLRITFPYLLFVSILAYSGSILNTFGQFAVPSITPVLLNVCMILAAIYLAPLMPEPIIALAWGVLIAGLVQLMFQLPFLVRMGLAPKPKIGLAAWKHPGVKRILKLMGPVIFGSSVAQINILLDTVIASFLAVGSLSWLYYSDRLMQFPLGILGVAVATVILPRLAIGHTHNADTDFRNTLDWAIRLTLLVGIPASAGLFYLASPLIATLFEYGEFSAGDTRMTSFSLMAYALGVPAFILTKVMLPAFFSRHDTRTPVRIGIIALISNMFYNLILVIPMVLTGFLAPHTGLAIASAMSAWQQTWMLYQRLSAEGVYRISKPLKAFCLKIVVAIIVMSVAILLSLHLIGPGNNWTQLLASQRSWLLLAIIVLSACSYFLTLWVLGVRPRDLRS